MNTAIHSDGGVFISLRYWLGVFPQCFLKALLNVDKLENPLSSAMSTTARPVVISSIQALLIRSRSIYSEQVMPWV